MKKIHSFGVMDCINAKVSYVHVSDQNLLKKIYGKCLYFLQVPNLIYVDSKGIFHFISRSFDLLSIARINGTFIPSTITGSCTLNGTYDGVIGNLERNITDFSIQVNSFESIITTRCEMPGNFDTLLQQQSSHIISSPVLEETRIVRSVYEAFLVFDRNVSLLMLVLYIASVMLLIQSASVNRLKHKCICMLTRVWFKQDTNDSIMDTHSQKAIISTSKILLFHFHQHQKRMQS